VKATRVDLNDPDAFVAEVPHAGFDWLRANEPVAFFEEDDGPGFWSLTRYADVVAVSRDYVTFSSTHGVNIEDARGGFELAMINMDPPKHTKLRALVSKGFTPRRVSLIEDHIRDVTRRIVDGVASRGECDFVTDVAAELPLQVIAELIGVPMEDRHKVFHWTNTMIGLTDPEYGASIDDATTAAMEMYMYWEHMAEEHRAERREDLIAALLEAEVDGAQLSNVDIDVFLMLLAVAGNETTRNTIAGGMLELIRSPEQRDRLLADRSLLATAVDEMVRWVTPVMYFRRTATCDAEIAGQPIRAGDKILMWYIAANRDPEVFPEPHRFDVGRTPNEHVGFGAGGPHFCLGANLARMEIRIMFEELLDRLPDIELAGPPARLRSNFISGLKHIPVRFTPERA
jgi:cholest-4-en-3-one 26-monooxygenase